MGTKEVIDYVMNSPGNTNKAVLRGLLGDMAENGSDGVVSLSITLWDENHDPMQTLDADEANALVKDRDTIHRVCILAEDDGHSEHTWHWIQSLYLDDEDEGYIASFVNVSTDSSGSVLNPWLSHLEVMENQIGLMFGGTQSVYQYLWVKRDDGTWIRFDD